MSIWQLILRFHADHIGAVNKVLLAFHGWGSNTQVSVVISENRRCRGNIKSYGGISVRRASLYDWHDGNRIAAGPTSLYPPEWGLC